MILEAISRHAVHQGEKIAFCSSSGTLTYRQLWQQAQSLGEWLQQDQGPVMVCGRKEPLVPVAFLACLLAGRPYLPTAPDLPAHRLETICLQAGVSTILCTGALPALKDRKLLKSDAMIQLCQKETCPLPFPEDSSRDAYWLFTSGSTGVPKGVRISIGALENFVNWMLSLPPIADCAQETTVNQAPFSFDLSVADLWPTLVAGGTVFALDKEQENLSLLYRALAHSGGTRLTCTPSFVRLCLCDSTFCSTLMPRLHTIFLCGETLFPRTAQQLLQRFPHLRILNAYGPTEATCAVCAVLIDQPSDQPLPVGKVADAASQILILDKQGLLLPEGRVGEIAIAGPSVGSGYVNTSAGGFGSFQGVRLYRTGDAGSIREGLLWYHGRLDRQIKYKGYRIEPEEIEAALLQWPEVRAAAVLPVKRGETVTGLAAFIEWAETPLNQAECKQRLEPVLPLYMYPRRWHTVEQMPMTRHGKCDLQCLEEMLDAESTTETSD